VTIPRSCVVALLVLLSTCVSMPTASARVQLAVSGGSHWPSREEGYDSVPVVGIRLARNGDSQVTLIAGFQYMWGSNDANDRPCAMGPAVASRLRAGLLEFGFRAQPRTKPGVGFTFGSSVLIIRASGEYCSGSPSSGEESTHANTHPGLALFTGPTWQPAKCAFRVGIEGRIMAHWSGHRGEGDRWEVGLTGVSARVYVERGL
jgi:hypothetical protein